MLNQLDHFAINVRLFQLSEALSAGCDPDFDSPLEELDREFQELRLQLRHFE